MKMEKRLKGFTLVEGLGRGKAYFVGRALKQDSVVSISRDEVGEQIMRFNEIREKAKNEYRLYTKNFEATSTFDTSILNIYEHILDDPAFIGQIVEMITTELFDLQTSIRLVSNDFIKRFNAAGTSYFKERSSDMVEICEKLMTYIDSPEDRAMAFTGPVVLVVMRTFTLSDILNYDIDYIAGVISASGGKTSHAAILARSYSIPVISGIRNIAEYVRQDDELLVDADRATVYIQPSDFIKSRYKEVTKKSVTVSKELQEKWQGPVYTKDGVHIKVLANISIPNDLNLTVENGADGVGLVRTEYLLSNKKEFPSEEEQVEFYKSIFEKLGKKECVIRVMDIGGDKIPEFFKMPVEYNPFMGWRAIRVLLERKDIFKKQLRSIIIAGQGYNYKIMFPMVTTLKEWIQAKEVVQEVSDNLGLEFPKCGVLFEVPLAILEMETFMKEIDFASIGTNDLLQYLSAADRNNPKVNYLYNPIEPAFLKILKTAIETSKDNGISVSICGEMAGNPVYTALLVGLGLRIFSIIPRNIPIIKELISNISFAEIAEKVSHLSAIKTPEGVKRWIKKVNKQTFGDLLEKIPSLD